MEWAFQLFRRRIQRNLSADHFPNMLGNAKGHSRIEWLPATISTYPLAMSGSNDGLLNSVKKTCLFC